jgi:lipopolysaccharide export system permease protein
MACRVGDEKGGVEMTTLDRYLATHVIWGVLLTLCVFLALFTFVSLVDELGDVGKGDYTLLRAFEYMLLTLPQRGFLLFPFAALVGTLVGLGALSSSSELTVMRASGLSAARICVSVLTAGLALAVMSMLVGEFVAPLSERLAHERRSVAISSRINVNANYGFWVRDGSSFVNIRRALPGNQAEGVYIYEFDADNQLRVATYARKASYEENGWVLEGIRQSEILEYRVMSRDIERAAWEAKFKPNLVDVVAVKPESLSAAGLFRYIEYLRENELSTARYELAFWTKLVYPAATVVMIFFALPMLLGMLRSAGVGQRILVGSIVGMAFHVVNQISGDIGLVYGLPPSLSAVLPTLVFLAIGTAMMRRL